MLSRSCGQPIDRERVVHTLRHGWVIVNGRGTPVAKVTVQVRALQRAQLADDIGGDKLILTVKGRLCLRGALYLYPTLRPTVALQWADEQKPLPDYPAG